MMKRVYLLIGQCDPLKGEIYIKEVNFGPLALDENRRTLPIGLNVLVHGDLRPRVILPDIDDLLTGQSAGSYSYPDIDELFRQYKSGNYDNFYTIDLDKALEIIGTLGTRTVEYFKGANHSSEQIAELKTIKRAKQAIKSAEKAFYENVAQDADRLDSRWDATYERYRKKWAAEVAYDKKNKGKIWGFFSPDISDKVRQELARQLQKELADLAVTIAFICKDNPETVEVKGVRQNYVTLAKNTCNEFVYLRVNPRLHVLEGVCSHCGRVHVVKHNTPHIGVQYSGFFN